eukprot:757669-Hanusia_phi.AAC.3
MHPILLQDRTSPFSLLFAEEFSSGPQGSGQEYAHQPSARPCLRVEENPLLRDSDGMEILRQSHVRTPARGRGRRGRVRRQGAGSLSRVRVKVAELDG